MRSPRRRSSNKLFTASPRHGQRSSRKAIFDGTLDITSDNTPDRDYGMLLERAYGKGAHGLQKGLASPTGFEPVFQP